MITQCVINSGSLGKEGEGKEREGWEGGREEEEQEYPQHVLIVCNQLCLHIISILQCHLLHDMKPSGETTPFI